MRTDIFDERPFDSDISIANLDWWMDETNGKKIEEYELFPKPLIYGQNFNSLLQAREEHKKLTGNNKDLVGWGSNPNVGRNDKSRVSDEVLDIMANYMLVNDVDYTRKLNNVKISSRKI